VAEPQPGVGRQLSRTKRGLGIDVLTAARRRVRDTFSDFPNVYCSFSGGKDSGVLLELAAVEARRRGRRLGVLIVDLEAQYQHTIDYVHAMLKRHADVLDVYWVCLPLSLRNAVSQFQPKWMCWDPAEKDTWVRPLPEHPGVVADEEFFDFFHRGMEFEELVPAFGQWYSALHGGRMTACLVGIRTQESLNRWRTIASVKKKQHRGRQWTTWLGGELYNTYPLYDWRTEDIWRYYGRERVPYNRVYDLMHQAGLTIHQARLCQPYGDDQKQGLWLYHIIEPHTWTKLLCRVQGANFGARYSRETGNISGRITISKPDGMTWEEYAHALLDSMPPPTAEHFKDKIARFLYWYDQRGYPGGLIPDDGPLDKKTPSWRRICKVLLSYDYYCKGLSFSPPAHQESYKRYRKRMAARRQEWGYNRLS
jgi:predicted phosphoadenosine phosphosulfate sulfurtransferase